MRISQFLNEHKAGLKSLLVLVIGLIGGILAQYGISLTATPTEEGIDIAAGFKIELADEQVPAVIETDEGEIETIDAPTVEEIDSPQLVEDCAEGEECGKGWYVDTSTPTTFKDAVIGQCIDTDGHYGSQCWDMANLFWQNTANRWLSTCGTGAAKGTIQDGCWQQNAGDEFVMIWDPAQIQAGDIVVFTNGQYGHIGMAMGGYNGGYVALLGTNQGGAACQGGGSTANIINISLKNFGGAFRYKEYIQPEPEPEPIPISGCVQWHVLKGDTMSKIMLECEGTVVYGEPMNAYARTWYSLVYKPGQSVYDGWNSKTGVGLYAGDDIEHRIGGNE